MFHCRRLMKILKSKYSKKARLEIQVVEVDEEAAFTEEDFWFIIAGFNWKGKTREEIIEPALKILADRPISHIYAFEDMMASKLRELDTEAHAKTAYPGLEKISVDGFLYVRAGAVVKGKNNYYAILQNPSELDNKFDFEPLLSIAALAYNRIDYETYSNVQGWPSE